MGLCSGGTITGVAKGKKVSFLLLASGRPLCGACMVSGRLIENSMAVPESFLKDGFPGGTTHGSEYLEDGDTLPLGCTEKGTGLRGPWPQDHD